MAKIIKNISLIEKIYAGMTILSGETYLIPDEELAGFQKSDNLINDLTKNPAEASIYSDSDATELTGSSAVDFLKDFGPIEVIYTSDQLTPDGKIQKVSVYKAEGSSATKVTHDFTDPCTWYQKSVQVLGKELVGADSLYSCGDINLIDIKHGRLYGEDELTNTGNHWKINVAYGLSSGRTYEVKVYDNEILLTEDVDYIVNHEAGTFDFTGYIINGTLTADYYKATTSEFVLTPTAGKIMIIEHAELQLSIDCLIAAPLNFEIWVYHPNQAQYPGLKIPYQMLTYKNIKDILNACNEGTGIFPKMDGLQNDVVVLPFKYATVKPFRSSFGAELRMTSDTPTLPLSGEWGTATFYILSQDE